MLEMIKEKEFTIDEVKREMNKLHVNYEELCDYLLDKFNLNYDDYLINPYRTKGMV